MRITSTLAALAAAVVVASCGGDDFRATPATSAVPPSASQSINGFIAYLKELVIAAADTLEPVDTSMVTGPTDETSEPQTVD